MERGGEAEKFFGEVLEITGGMGHGEQKEFMDNFYGIVADSLFRIVRGTELEAASFVSFIKMGSEKKAKGV